MTARRPLLLVVLAFAPVVAAAASGCLSATDQSLTLTPFTPLVTAEPGRMTQFAVHVNSTGSFRSEVDVRVEDVPANWTAEPEVDHLGVDGGSSTTVLVNVTPGTDAGFGLTRLSLLVGGASTDLLVNVDALGTEPAREGVGVQVFSVGFWDNGTIFWTNMRDVRDNDAIPWPHAPGDAADENMQPLKVYIGGERGERPPEPYNSSGYHTVIQGFRDGLLQNGGMRANETLAVRIAPEDAYTYDGNEDHFLYGDSLNFVMHVVSVDVLEDSRICVPGGPPEACLDPDDPLPDPPARVPIRVR